MKKFVNVVLLLVLFISSIMNCILVRDLEEKTLELIELTDVEPEIVFLDSLVYDTVFIEKYELVKLPIYNTDTIKQTDTLTLVEIDSANVVLPIEVKHYSDTFSNVSISFSLKGFNCEIDSLYVKNFLSVPTQEKAVKKWYDNIHLGAGLSVTYIDKFRLVPTVGIYYKLL